MAENTSQLSILVKVRDEASAALGRLSGDVSGLGGSLNFASLGAGALAGGMAAIAGAAIMDTVKAFADSEQQMAKFNAIVKTLPADLQKYKDQMLATANSALKFGFDNDNAAVSIARLFQATGDAQLSFQAFQAAMDLARYKGISLDDATQALILAFQGGGRMLKQLGIEIDEHASRETILAAVMKATAGQAEAYAQTFNGVKDVMSVYIGEVKEAMGQPFAEFIKLVILQLKGWTDAQGGINTLIEKHSTLLTVAGSILAGVFLAGVAVATAAILAAIGPFGTILAILLAMIGVGAALAAAWKTDFLGIRTFLEPIINTIIGWFSSIVSWVQSAVSAVSSFASAAKSVTTGAISGVKSFLGLAEGGIVTRPTFAMVGEAGPEAVIPLSQLGMTGGGINIYLQGDFYTTAEIAEKFAGELARLIKLQVRV